MKPAFIPGHHSSLLYPLAMSMGRTIIRVLQNIQDIQIEPETVHYFESMRKKRLIVVANHPSTAEPPLTAYLGKLTGYPFHFLASRQVFEWEHGVIGKLISRLGAYSVIAGIPDKESVRFSKNIIRNPECKLVIYPEGEPTSGENDTLMPFQPGVAQLSFWGMDAARKDDPQADATIVPLFFRYEFIPDAKTIHENLEKRISKLERKLGIRETRAGILGRTITLSRVLLEQLEAKNGIEPEGDYSYRVGRVRHALLDAIAEKLGLSPLPEDMNAILKFRKVFSRIELYMIEYPDPKLPKLSKQDIDWCLKAAVRAFDYIVMHRDHLLEEPTYEKIDEWIVRFESFVFGKKPRALGGVPSSIPKRAYIIQGSPFLISAYYTKESSRRKHNVQKLTERLREELQSLLDQSLVHAHSYSVVSGELDGLKD